MKINSSYTVLTHTNTLTKVEYKFLGYLKIWVVGRVYVSQNNTAKDVSLMQEEIYFITYKLLLISIIPQF